MFQQLLQRLLHLLLVRARLAQVTPGLGRRDLGLGGVLVLLAGVGQALLDPRQPLAGQPVQLALEQVDPVLRARRG